MKNKVKEEWKNGKYVNVEWNDFKSALKLSHIDNTKITDTHSLIARKLSNSIVFPFGLQYTCITYYVVCYRMWCRISVKSKNQKR